MSIEHIAYNIKFFREQFGWTQEELAKRVLSSRSKVAKWENKSVTPDIDSLIQLSEIFDVTLDHLVGRQSFQKDLLTDFKRIYQLESPTYDEEVITLMEYILQHPHFKENLLELHSFSMAKQQSVHKIFSEIINEYKKL